MESKSQEISLVLESGELGESAIRAQELALRRMLRENADECEILEEKTTATTGAKGDPITVGLIVMALIKSGAAVALLNCLKALFLREKKLKIKVTTKDGRTVELDATNVDSEAVRQQLAALEES